MKSLISAFERRGGFLSGARISLNKDFFGDAAEPPQRQRPRWPGLCDTRLDLSGLGFSLEVSAKARFEAAPKGKARCAASRSSSAGATSWSRVERIVARVEASAEGPTHA